MKTVLQFLQTKTLLTAALTFFLLINGSKSFAQIIDSVPGSRGADFAAIYGVAVDDSNNVFAADWTGHTVIKMTPHGVHTIFKSLNGPVGLVFDEAKNLYVTEWDGDVIIRISPAGKIDTIARKGLTGPEGIAIDPSDTILYATDWTANKVYAVSIATGVVTTIGDTSGKAGNAGDNGPAVAATFGGIFGSSLEEVAVDSGHNIYIADPLANRVRVIAGTSTSRHPVVGYIYAFAGTGAAGSTGDGNAATLATLTNPTGVIVDKLGNVFITDQGNSKIRKVDTAGIITTYAGTGTLGSTGDGGLATLATLNLPYGLAFDKYGNLFETEAQAGANRIRHISLPGCVTPGISSAPVSNAVCPGTGNISFSVSTNGSGPLTYQWKRNGVNVGANDSIYSIGKVALSDSGKYTVVVSNFCGSTASETVAGLTVFTPPAVVISPSFDTICKGATVPLSATGANTYSWAPSTNLNNTTGYNVAANPSNSLTYTVTGADNNGCTASAVSSVTVNICTGLASVNEEELNIYPNPGDGIFTIQTNNELTNGKLELFNLAGQKIYEETFDNVYSRTFDMSKYGGGVYLLQITSANGIFRKKVIVQ